jgi:hypothetical protein
MTWVDGKPLSYTSWAGGQPASSKKILFKETVTLYCTLQYNLKNYFIVQYTFSPFSKGKQDTKYKKNFMKTKDIMPATCTYSKIRNRSNTFPLIYSFLDRAKLTN